MKYNAMGKTGLLVSSLCFGTMTFGESADKQESFEMYRMCRDNGINIFDCADKYAGGESEKILGKCISGHRDEVIVTTKATSRVGSGVNDVGSSRKHLLKQIDQSLKSLGTDYIDIYYIHYFDPCCSPETILETLDFMVKSGKVLYTGLSNYAAWQIMKGLSVSRLRHISEISCIQPMYSLIKRQCEVEILPMAKEEGLAVFSYSPLGAGVLTGKYKKMGNNISARLYDKKYYKQRYEQAAYFEAAQKLVKIADQAGVNPAALAIRWVMENPVITAPIIGARNREQLKGSLKALEVGMDSELYNRVSSIYSSPDPAHDRLEEKTDKSNLIRNSVNAIWI